MGFPFGFLWMMKLKMKDRYRGCSDATFFLCVNHTNNEQKRKDDIYT